MFRRLLGIFGCVFGTLTADCECEVVQGEKLLSAIDEIAGLTIEVLREYPYLYDGSLEYEMGFMNHYVNSPHSVVVLLREEGRLIGAVTGVPLSDTFADCSGFFVDRNLPMEGIFYLGEITLLKEWRGQGLGAKMYEVFEKFVRDQGVYREIAFCEVVRSEMDPPADYFSLEGFWERRGYKKRPDWVTSFYWKEIGAEEEASYPMVFWTKSLNLSR